VLAPEGGEVEPEKFVVGVECGAILAGEESRVADEESGVGVGEHGEGVGEGFEEGGVGVVEVLEEDVSVGLRAAGGGVGGDGADLAEGFRGGEVVGIFYEEEDAADFVERGDGAAGDDGEVGGEGSDGDEAEVGAAGEEFVGTEGGRCVVHVVVPGERGGSGRVLEVEEEWGGVEKGNGGDAERHLKIVDGVGGDDLRCRGKGRIGRFG
jgi:hypothetical protein